MCTDPSHDAPRFVRLDTSYIVYCTKFTFYFDFKQVLLEKHEKSGFCDLIYEQTPPYYNQFLKPQLLQT